MMETMAAVAVAVAVVAAAVAVVLSPSPSNRPLWYVPTKSERSSYLAPTVVAW